MGSSTAAGSDARRSQLRDIARELYAGPRESFVASRTARAKSRRADGERDLAADVARLAKPTLLAWAIDQAVAANGADVEQLMETIASMQAPDSAKQLRALAAQHELIVERLGREAYRAIGGTGERTSDAAAAIRTVAISAAAQDFVDGMLATIPAAGDDLSLDAALAAGAALAPKRGSNRSAGAAHEDADASDARASAASRHELLERRRRIRGELAAARAEQRDADRARRDAERALVRAEHTATEAREHVVELEAQLAELD
jgi:hypothetical protein